MKVPPLRVESPQLGDSSVRVLGFFEFISICGPEEQLFGRHEYDPDLDNAHHLIRGIIVSFDLPVEFDYIFVEESHTWALQDNPNLVVGMISRMYTCTFEILPSQMESDLRRGLATAELVFVHMNFEMLLGPTQSHLRISRSFWTLEYLGDMTANFDVKLQIGILTLYLVSPEFETRSFHHYK
ncbi:hypothetical protein CHU98_g4411 [Xylaria longipes]|nr:hypothetical protein CHU98_g4411 [Xylaria longipes]